MDKGGLSPLQRRVLEVLGGPDERWTLVGGAALAGFHLRHRTTRDLDLFWRGESRLGDRPGECGRRLRDAGFEVVVVQSSDAFTRVRVSDAKESVIVDLVADPSAAIEEPVQLDVGNVKIRVAGVHEILVDKLCALLGRSEVRDLVDVRALLDAGGDLERALRDAPRKDAGFSPMTLSWVLRGMPLDAIAASEGLGSVATADLARFRADLVGRLSRDARPDA